MRKEFEKYMKIKRREWDYSKNDRIKLLGFDEDDIDEGETEEIIESEIIIETTNTAWYLN